MEGFKPFEPEKKKKFIIPENAVESGPEIKFEKGLGRKSDYNWEVIRELEAPIGNLVNQLKESIDKEEYDAIIGDDISGRIPTLALRKIFVSRIHELNPNLTAEEGREKLKTFFVVGGHRKQNDRKLLEFFKKIKPNIKKRLLFVTEYKNSGRSLLRISKLLEKVGIHFDIAAVIEESHISGAVKDDEFIVRGHNIFVGSFGGEPKIYHKKFLTGLASKLHNNKLHNLEEHYPKDAHAHVDDSGLKKRAVVPFLKQARQDVDLLASNILEKVWGDKH